jgi:predicted GNAT family acetyltransferase
MNLATPPQRLEIAVLSEESRPSLLQLLDQERWSSLYLRSLVHEFGVAPSAHLEHGRFVGARRGSHLTAVAFSGNSRNLTTLGEPADLVAVVAKTFEGVQAPRLFVGPSEHARLVREAFSRHGALPFLDREQYYYVLTPDALVEQEPLPIRPGQPDDVDNVTLAQAAMTQEDLSVPRNHIDYARLRDISQRRIESGKVWVLAEGSRLLFKTEESARSEDGVLIGGVFTDPEYRGRGLARRGIGTWARILFDRGLSLLALHVNRENLPAIRAYERVGFRRHASLRLMLTY